jgi:hypothetical protein
MGRKKEMEDGVLITFRVPRSSRDQVNTLGLKYRDVFERGIGIAKPLDLSALDFRLRQIPIEVSKVQREQALFLAEQRIKENVYLERIEILQREQEALQARKDEAMKEIEDKKVEVDKAFEEWLPMVPHLRIKCVWRDDDPGEIDFFKHKGITITCGELKKKLKARYGY